MKIEYEAWELPRGNIVVAITDGDRADPRVISEEITIQAAQMEASRLNTLQWLADKPGDTVTWDVDAECARLDGILDRMLGPEQIGLPEAA